MSLGRDSKYIWCAGTGKHQSRAGLEAADAKERIVIVTGVPTAPCTNPYGDYLLSLSMQNKQDYARLHSYEVHLMAEAVTSHIRAGPWQKVGFIQKVRTLFPHSVIVCSGESSSSSGKNMLLSRVTSHSQSSKLELFKP